MIKHPYGLKFQNRIDKRSLEWYCFLNDRSVEQGGVGKPEHFRRAFSMTWPHIEWQKTVKDEKGNKRVVRNHWMDRIVDAVFGEESATRSGDYVFRSVVLSGCGAAGKAQPLDSSVLTPDGFIKMGDVVPGTIVCTPDGGQAEVIQVFPQGEQDIYRITLSDGSQVEATEDHLWEIYRRNFKTKLADTRWLADNFDKGSKGSKNRRDFGIKFTKPVEMNARPLKLDPYLMGILLGDGSFGSKNGRGNLGLSNPEPEIIQRAKSLIDDDYWMRKAKDVDDYFIVRKDYSKHGPNKYKEILKGYGLFSKLSHEKYIPSDYLFSSVKQRWELLQGMMDTDGCAFASRATLSTSSERLAQDFKILVQSLGGTVRITKRLPKYTHNGEYRTGRMSYLCAVQHHEPEKLFSLPRKKTQMKKRRGGNHGRSIWNVEKIGRKQAQCILIDHPNHLYITDHFIPTHNTFTLACCLVGWWCVDPNNSIAVLTSTTKEMIGKRIWPTISYLHATMMDAPRRKSIKCGHLVDSRKMISSQPIEGDDMRSERNAIFAMAVAHGETQKAAHNLRGLHAERMMLVIDEANGTPEAIYETISNWRKGCKDMTVVLIGNPVSRLDPHGRAMEPVDGWDTIRTDTYQWRTKRVPQWDMDGGLGLRFDGADSPNVRAGVTVFPYIYTLENWKNAQAKNENTLAYWSQDRGLHPPEGLLETVLNEPALIAANVDEPINFRGHTTLCAFLDPAFGGDAAIIRTGKVGTMMDGRMGLLLIDRHEIAVAVLTGEGEQVAEPDLQVAQGFIELCKDLGIKPENTGIDATGTGRGCYAFVSTLWSPEVMRFEAAARPGDQPVMDGDSRPAKDTLQNRITESWIFAASLIRSGQMKGLWPNDKLEFTTRKLETRKLFRNKHRLEDKEEFKVRYGHSPDDADAVAGLADLARNRLGLSIHGNNPVSESTTWRDLEHSWDQIYRDPEDQVPVPQIQFGRDFFNGL